MRFEKLFEDIPHIARAIRATIRQEMDGRGPAGVQRARVDSAPIPFIDVGAQRRRLGTKIDDAIKRANVYVEAGADMIFVEAPTTEADIQRIINETKAPSWINMVEGGKTPLVPIPKLQQMGAALVDYGPLVLFAAAGGVERALQALKRDGTSANHLKELMLFNEINAINRIDDFRDMETRYTKR